MEVNLIYILINFYSMYEQKFLFLFIINYELRHVLNKIIFKD